MVNLVYGLPQLKDLPNKSIDVPNLNEPQNIIQSKSLHIEDKYYFSVGYGAGQFLDSDEYISSSSAQLRYIPFTEDNAGWDYEVGISNLNWLSLSAGKHWYCCPGDSFQPYARLAGTIYTLASEELAGITEYRRWRAHASVGLGSVVTTELGFGWSLYGRSLYLQLGFNF